MLKHKVVINVSGPEGKKATVLKGGNLKLRTRLLSFLFGEQYKMLVLVPSDSVQSVAIREVSQSE